MLDSNVTSVSRPGFCLNSHIAPATVILAVTFKLIPATKTAMCFYDQIQ